jgi:hypothetical protein
MLRMWKQLQSLLKELKLRNSSMDNPLDYNKVKNETRIKYLIKENTNEPTT